jgi:hypothetical protein
MTVEQWHCQKQQVVLTSNNTAQSKYWGDTHHRPTIALLPELMVEGQRQDIFSSWSANLLLYRWIAAGPPLKYITGPPKLINDSYHGEKLTGFLKHMANCGQPQCFVQKTQITDKEHTCSVVWKRPNLTRPWASNMNADQIFMNLNVRNLAFFWPLILTQLLWPFVTSANEMGWNQLIGHSASPTLLLLRRSLSAQLNSVFR